MKQILVGKNSLALNAKVGGGTISGINEINLLDTGAIAVFTDTNVMITSAGVVAQTSDVKGFYIAVGNQQTLTDGTTQANTYVSQIIPRMLLDYRKTAYVAPVYLIKYIGYDGTTAGTALNLPFTTAVAADCVEVDGKTKKTAFIKLINTTPGLRTMGAVYENEILRYEHVVKVGDTATTIIADLVAQVNADANKFVTAAAIGTPFGMSFTADAYGTTFSIAMGGVLDSATKEEPEGAVVGVSQAMKFGEGTSDQILTLEQTYSTERGNDNQTHLSQFYYKVPTNVVSGTTYDTYTFAWNGKRTISTGEQNTQRFETIVAMPHSATVQSAWETIMVTLVGLFESSETGS